MIVRVNGSEHVVEPADDERLVATLRDRLGLTGTKVGCAMGNCGACTVRLDGATAYSCLVLTVECDEIAITTIEGLAAGDGLDAVQRAFVECDAFQCGFCTPGQIMSVRALLDEVPHPTDEQIVHGLAGNLCRCGAYRHIIEAARVAAGTAGA